MNTEETTLWERFESTRSDDDKNALCVFYLHWLRNNVAVKLRKSLPPNGPDIEDLVNDAAPALLQCIERFRRDTGYEFATFALQRVRGAMLDSIRNMDWVPRLERRHAKLHPTVIKAMFPLSNFSRRFGKGSYHVEEQSERDFLPFKSRDPDPAAATDEEEFWKVVCAPLNKHQRLAVLMYFRMQMTMAQIGKSIGVSESRISQTITQVSKLLRESKRVQELTKERRAA